MVRFLDSQGQEKIKVTGLSSQFPSLPLKGPSRYSSVEISSFIQTRMQLGVQLNWVTISFARNVHNSFLHTCYE